MKPPTAGRWPGNPAARCVEQPAARFCTAAAPGNCTRRRRARLGAGGAGSPQLALLCSPARDQPRVRFSAVRLPRAASRSRGHLAGCGRWHRRGHRSEASAEMKHGVFLARHGAANCMPCGPCRLALCWHDSVPMHCAPRRRSLAGQKRSRSDAVSAPTTAHCQHRR